MLPPPVVIEQPTAILITMLLILGSAMIGAILLAAHRASLTTPSVERRTWFALLGFAILAIGLTRPGPNADYVSPADRVVLKPAPATKITLDTADCGPRTTGHTDQLVFTVESQADRGPVVTGCTRIATRQYAIDQHATLQKARP